MQSGHRQPVETRGDRRRHVDSGLCLNCNGSRPTRDGPGRGWRIRNARITNDTASRPILMPRRYRFLIVTALLSLLCAPLAGPRGQAADKLPTELSDRAFWQMIADFSEPGGVFRSD